MKKIGVICLTVILLASAVSADEDPISIKDTRTELIGKIGTAYASRAEKFGLDVSFSYIYRLDPFFVAGLEADFFWLSWERSLGQKEIGETSATVKADTSAYTVPVFFIFQVRLPNLVDKIYVEPSITGGLGYSVMILNNSIPDYTDNDGNSISSKSETDLYSGFTWEVYLSASFRPAKESKINFIFDLGYRAAYPEKDNFEFNMSGFMVKTGVKFTL